MTLIEKIQSINKLYHGKGCTDEQIQKAEQDLGIKFPNDYCDYVKEYGAISFWGTEWTGLNVNGNINVVSATKQEKRLNPHFPTNCFVLENLGIDGVITIMDQEGQIFELQYEKKTPLCRSLSEYLDLCLKRQ